MCEDSWVERACADIMLLWRLFPLLVSREQPLPAPGDFFLMGNTQLLIVQKKPVPHSNLDFQVKCLNFKYSSIVKRHFAVHSNYIGRADCPQAASLQTMQTTQRQHNKLWANVYIPPSL